MQYISQFESDIFHNLLLSRALDTVTEKAIAHFRPTAQKILENRDPADALAAALACITGTTDIVPRSLLTKKEVKHNLKEKFSENEKINFGSNRIIQHTC